MGFLKRRGRVFLELCAVAYAVLMLMVAIIPWVGPDEFYRRCAGAVPERMFYRYEKAMSENFGAQNR